jgi:hypothetical protein
MNARAPGGPINPEGAKAIGELDDAELFVALTAAHFASSGQRAAVFTELLRAGPYLNAGTGAGMLASGIMAGAWPAATGAELGIALGLIVAGLLSLAGANWHRQRARAAMELAKALDPALEALAEEMGRRGLMPR